jgi:hypothetical protein
MKKLVIVSLILLVAFFLSVFYLNRPAVPFSNNVPDNSTVGQDAPIPTADIKAQDPADQQLVDELNQYQDASFDKDFIDIESQL